MRGDCDVLLLALSESANRKAENRDALDAKVRKYAHDTPPSRIATQLGISRGKVSASLKRLGIKAVRDSWGTL